MASIEKQPNGKWRARYRDANGRSRRKTFARKTDAQAFLDNTSTDIRRGEWIDPRARRETFDEWADRWWATTVRLRPTTRRSYWQLLELHVRPRFTGCRLADIDFADIEDFVSELLGAGLSAKYVRESLVVLSQIMKLAVRANVRRDNPAAGHQLPTRRRKVHEGNVLTMQQVELLVSHIRDPYKPAVWLYVYTGMRPSELCGLRLHDVDFIRHTVRVAGTLTPVHKFADVPFRRDVEGPTKTDDDRNTIPIPEWLCDDLAAMVAKRHGGQAPKSRAEFLFQTRYGNPINRDKFRQEVLRPALRAAGLPDSIRTYDLRHTHASLLIDQGASVLAVAQRMGHTDPAMTLRVYGHLFEGVQQELTDKLDALREATASSAPSEIADIATRRAEK